MKTLVKVNNNELSFRLKLNYNNVYSRLRMVLGPKASLFADLSTKAVSTTWFTDDNAEYTRLSDADPAEVNRLSVALDNVIRDARKEIQAAPELSKYVDDILEVPDNTFVFYREKDGEYKFVLTAWGCMMAHQNASDPNSGFIRRNTKDVQAAKQPKAPHVVPEPPIPPVPPVAPPVNGTPGPDADSGKKEVQEKKEEPAKSEAKSTSGTGTTAPSDPKLNTSATGSQAELNNDVKPANNLQHVILRVKDQNDKPVVGETLKIQVGDKNITQYTDANGEAEIGSLPYGSAFSVNLSSADSSYDRSFEVEPGVEVYETYIKKLVKYSPVLFVEDQHGSSVQDYNVKVVVNGQESTHNTGGDGTIQLPTMQEGQNFVVIDAANYANTQEYSINAEEAKKPYHFTVKRAEASKVGITVLNEKNKPIQGVSVAMNINDVPLQQMTDANGRAEFPGHLFEEGNIPVTLDIKGKGQVNSNLNYTRSSSEYTIQIQNGSQKPKPKYNLKWLALIPLLFLLGWGGYELYKWLTPAPSEEEMAKGVCLIYQAGYYYMDPEIKDLQNAKGEPLKVYFNYDIETDSISNITFDKSEAQVEEWTGTGFLISDNGYIATNRHVADPELHKEDIVIQLKKEFQREKDQFLHDAQKYADSIQFIGFNVVWENAKRYCQYQAAIRDKILNTAKFEPKFNSLVLGVAFTGTRIQGLDDFIKCSTRASGSPAGWNEKDLAIIQVNKEQDIPKGKYIFKVPEKDLTDEEIANGDEITVIGFHDGMSLQDLKKQDGIDPIAQHGQISRHDAKYNIEYDASIDHGSSGSPVVNKKGQLVAVNNAGAKQGFSFGIKTKYLKELLDSLKTDKTKE